MSDYTQPTQHIKSKKHQHHGFPHPPASSGFNFIGEWITVYCTIDLNLSTQHGDVVFIEETNEFFFYRLLSYRPQTSTLANYIGKLFKWLLVFFLGCCIKTMHTYPSHLLKKKSWCIPIDRNCNVLPIEYDLLIVMFVNINITITKIIFFLNQ